MKKVLFKILSASFLIVSLFSCIKDPEVSPGVRGADVPVFEGGATISGKKTASSVEMSAKITMENGSKITERGFYYGTEPIPTPENGGEKEMDESGDVGIGSYTLTIDGLTNDTTYYFLPYAINGEGTGYGDILSVNTNPGLGIVMTIEPYDGLASSFKAGAELISEGEGNSDNITIGIYLYTSINPDVAVDTITYAIFSAENKYYYQITDLMPSTAYYVKAFIENDYGIFIGSAESITTRDGRFSVGETSVIPGYTDATFSSSVNNGNDETVTIVERGFYLSKTTPEPTSDDIVVRCGGGTGDFSGMVDYLETQQSYYVRAYAINNFNMTEYGEVRSFSTIKDVPTVETETVDISKVQNGNAEIRGIITDKGKSNILYSGICWSTTNQTPEETDNFRHISAGVGVAFTVQLSNLRGGIRYYVRAFARNDDGISYGDTKYFDTPPIIGSGLMAFPGVWRQPSSTAYFAIDDKLYILGGDLGPSYTDELYAYSISDNDWTQLRSFAGGPARWQTAVSYGSGAYVYGGYDGSGDEKAGLYYYKASGENDWDNSNYGFVQDSVTVSKAIGCALGSSVFFIGGVSGDTVRSDVWCLLAQSSWLKKPDFPEEQHGGVAVVINSEVYAGLGKNASGACNGKLWKTADGADNWELITTCSIYQGSILAGVVCNNRLYVIDESYHILEYDPVTDLWTKKHQLPSTHRDIHCMYTHRSTNQIYIGLGSSVSRSLIVYDPSWDN